MFTKTSFEFENLTARIAAKRQPSAIVRALRSYVGRNGTVREQEHGAGWVAYYKHAGSIVGGTVFVHRLEDGGLRVTSNEAGGSYRIGEIPPQ